MNINDYIKICMQSGYIQLDFNNKVKSLSLDKNIKW